MIYDLVALAGKAAVSQAVKARGLSIVNTESQTVAARYSSIQSKAE